MNGVVVDLGNSLKLREHFHHNSKTQQHLAEMATRHYVY